VSDKFAMGSLGIGPFSGMLDSMEFVKQAWSTLSLPNNLTPTMDLEEIDRRIADLKVVEQWLTMNLAMLRSSIQGMEIQRGTIAAIRAFGEAMASPPEGGEPSARTEDTEERSPPHAQEQEQEQEQPRDEAAPASAQAAQAAPGAASPESLADEISKAAVAAVNPAAWWKLLQTQFGQIAQAALSGAAHKAAAGPATAPGPAAPASASRGTADQAAATARKTTESARGARKGRPQKKSAKTGGGARKRAGDSTPVRSKGRETSKGGRPAKG